MCCPLTLATFLWIFSLFPEDHQHEWTLPGWQSLSAESESILAIPGPAPNGRPIVISPVPDQEISTLSSPLQISFYSVFSSDDDNDDLSFSAVANNNNIVDLEIRDDTLFIYPQREGTVRIRLIARDDDNGQATDVFSLTIRENTPPQIISQINLRDQKIILDSPPFTLNLITVFEDLDGDPLEFSAFSSNPIVSRPTVEQGILTVPPQGVGVTTIQISADDNRGGFTEAEFSVEVLRPYPARMDVNIFREFGPAESSSSYRLIALPGDQVVSIAETTEGAPNEQWVSYAPDPEDTSLLIPFDESDAFLLQPGNGLWFLSTEAWSIPSQRIPTVPLSRSGTYKIPLHAGWNIISNPFDTDIPWRDITTRNNISEALWSWENGYTLTDTFSTAATRGEAFYMFNAQNRDSLELPYPDLASPFFFKTKHKTRPTQLQITAVSEKNAHSSVFIGFSEEAALGLDAMDYIAPPSHFSEVDLAIDALGVNEQGLTLAADIRPPLTSLQQYNLLLQIEKHERIQLQITGSASFESASLVLINTLDGSTYNLHQRTTLSLDPLHQEIPLQVLIGDEEAVMEIAESTVPTLLTLKQNYPNPFLSFTTIEFSLPSAQYTSLEIYDNMGRRIRTLIDGYTEAGLHRIKWKGQNDNQQPVANGVYFYRLTGTHSSLTQKMILLH